jgi:hypothetical protein
MTCPNPDLALSRARTQINTRARVGCRPRARRRTGSGSGARRRRQTTRRPHGGVQRYPGSAPPTSPTRCGHRRSLRPPPPPSCRCRGRLDTGFSRAIAAGFGRRTVDGPPVGAGKGGEVGVVSGRRGFAHCFRIFRFLFWAASRGGLLTRTRARRKAPCRSTKRFPYYTSDFSR